MRISVIIVLCYCFFAGRVTVQSTASFIAVSDIHLDTSNTPTWEAAAKTMTQIAQGKNGGSKPSFILYLGDLPVHSNPHSSAQVANAMKEAGMALKGL